MTLVYDVESTGIPDWKKPSNDPSQPHITQVAAIWMDDDGVELERLNLFIKPYGWTIPDEIVKLTGITQEKLETEGVPIKDAIDAFITVWRKSKITVAHNDSFDRRVLRIELARLFGKADILEEWKKFPAFCTMIKSTAIIKLPPTEKMMAYGMNTNKPPKLQEAYKHFYGVEPEKSHDAMADVESTRAVYLKLKGAV